LNRWTGLQVRLQTVWIKRLAVGMVLAASSAALFATSPTNGDFWWQDAPRHALNGAFVTDLLADLPWRHPVGWAMEYYLKYPSLTILFYPPFFYFAEAASYAVFGVSHAAAQFTVAVFDFVLAIASYQFARRVLPRGAALGVALLLIGAPQIAFWGRQVMLDIPAYATALLGLVCLVDYLRRGRPRDIYFSALFLVISTYTKFNVGFLLPVMLLSFVAARGRSMLRDRHALTAALLAAVALIPAVYLMLRFSPVNIESVAGRPGDLSRWSFGAWLFYGAQVPYQLGYVTTALAVCGAVVLAVRRRRVMEDWLIVLIVAWFVLGYLTFSFIDVREPRHDLTILYPLVLVAGLGVQRLFGGHVLAQSALVGLGVATLGYSLMFDPVPIVKGYRQIADYVAQHAPHDAVVVFSGYRDGNFVFDMRTHEERRDLTILRADKLLLRMAVERSRGVRQASYDQAQIASLLRNDGVGLVVAQVGFWNDLQEMSRFADVLHSSDFKQVATFDITGTLSTNDSKNAAGEGQVAVYQPTYPVKQLRRDLMIDMPFIHERFSGPIQ
jgi:hypothetical protein